MAQRGAGPDAHDVRETRAVGNHLLKWQLQQDRVRLAQLQQRVRRMTTSERPEAEAAGDKTARFQPKREQNRRQPTRSKAAQDLHDPEEDELMQMLTEREQHEAATASSRVPRPAVLPPLRRPVHRPRPPSSSSSQTMSSSGLRTTGRKLNAAGDFYSPVRPSDSAPSSAAFPPTRPTTTLDMSGIAAPDTTATSHAHAQKTPSTWRYQSSRPLQTPERWRRDALRSNQTEADGSLSVRRRRDQEDAAQADRLLEKAAREADPDALWHDLFYGTKAARARTKQQLDGGPTRPVVYSTSSFPEVLSYSRSSSPHSSCYEATLDNKAKSTEQDGSSDDLMPSSNQQDKLDAMPPSHKSSPSTSSKVVTPTEAFAQLGAARKGRSEGEKGLGGDIALQKPPTCTNPRDGDQKQALNDHAVHQKREQEGAQVADGGVFPSRWGLVVLVSCVVGVSGFCVEELLALLGLFSKGASFNLSRTEQQRMRERLGALQRELQGFRSAASEIEEHSQKVFDEVKRHLDRMRLDRERHKDLIAQEMHELRRYVLRITYEMVEQEREVIHAQLKETVGIQILEEDDVARGTQASQEAELSEGLHDPKSSQGSDVSEEPATAAFSIVSQSSGASLDSESSTTSQSPEPSQLPLDSEPLKPSGGPESSKPREPMTASIKPETENVIPVRQEAPASLVEDDADVPGLVEPAVLSPHEQHVQVPDLDVLVLKAGVTEIGDRVDGSFVSPKLEAVGRSEASRGTTLMSWELSLLVLAIAFLGGCIALRVHNMNRRKRWFEERRQRRYREELRMARERVKAEVQEAEEHERFEEEENEWDSVDPDSGVETVALMTPIADSEDEDEDQHVEEKATFSPWETDEDTVQDSSVYRSYTPVSPEPRRRTPSSSKGRRRRRHRSPRR